MGSRWTRSIWGRLAALVACVVSGCAPDVEGVREVPPEELTGPPPTQGRLILDVRTPGEYAGGHVPGAMNIPHTQVAGRVAELEDYRDAEIVLYCERGYRAFIAADALAEAGFSRLGHMSGDMRAWRAKDLPMEKSEPAAE